MKRNCVLLGEGQIRFCYECQDFPCRCLKNLDKRYQTKYHMSMIDNLRFIQEHGIGKFLAREDERWRCSNCGDTVCCHNGLCMHCELNKLRHNKKYRWGEERMLPAGESAGKNSQEDLL